MPVQYEVDPAHRLVLATAVGVVTEVDLRNYIESVLAHPDLRPGFRELADLRGLTRIEISVSAIVGGVPGAIRGLERQLKETKTALVASKFNLEMVSRLYEFLRTSVPTTVRLFTDMDEARQWLGLAEERREGERRVAPRREVPIPVFCQIGTQNHSAEIINLSLSGALLSCPTIRPAIGTPVEIQWRPPGSEEGSMLRGTVVRNYEGGFAVRFPTMTADLLRFLGDPF